jgi:hypothetical protein
MGTGTSLGLVDGGRGPTQPLNAQLEQVIATKLPDGRDVWQIDFTLAVAPGLWTVVVDDVDSLERLYHEILLSGNERLGAAQRDSAEEQFGADALLNTHEGAVFSLLSLIH